MNRLTIGSPSGMAMCALLAIGTLFGLAGINDLEPGWVGLVVVKIGDVKGIEADTLDTGMWWVNPVTKDVVQYDTRDKQYPLYDVENNEGIRAETKDGQPVTIDISLQLGLTNAGVPNLHETVGKDYFNQVVLPLGRSTTRRMSSSVLSDEIYTGDGRRAVQDGVEAVLREKLEPLGMRVSVNLRKVVFVSNDFVKVLETKASTAQLVTIKEREAEAAVNEAQRIANLAEGNKQKIIKEAEADKEKQRLEGEGLRLKDEERAKGLLALARAKAEGTRLQVMAYGSGKTYASVKWAEHLGPNVKVYGIPTGAPGTSSLVDINSVLKGAFAGAKQ